MRMEFVPLNENNFDSPEAFEAFTSEKTKFIEWHKSSRKVNDDMLKDGSIFKMISAEPDREKRGLMAAELIHDSEGVVSDISKLAIAEKYFPDHHPYRGSDIKKLSALAAAHDAHLITTTKDWVRVPAGYQHMVEFLPVNLHVDQIDDLTRLLLSQWH